MPELEKVRQELEPRGVGFLAVSLDQDFKRTRVAAEGFKISMTVATAASEMLDPYHLTVVPSTLFVDPSGRIILALNGSRSLEDLRREARVLAEGLAKPPPP